MVREQVRVLLLVDKLKLKELEQEVLNLMEAKQRVSVKAKELLAVKIKAE